MTAVSVLVSLHVRIFACGLLVDSFWHADGLRRLVRVSWRTTPRPALTLLPHTFGQTTGRYAAACHMLSPYTGTFAMFAWHYPHQSFDMLLRYPQQIFHMLLR